MIADIQTTLANPVDVYDTGTDVRYVGPVRGVDLASGVLFFGSCPYVVVVVVNFSTAPDDRPVGLATAWKEQIQFS
jgi:hypothetical protein